MRQLPDTIRKIVGYTLVTALGCAIVAAGVLITAAACHAAPTEEVKRLRAETKAMNARIAELRAPLDLQKAQDAHAKARAKLEALQRGVSAPAVPKAAPLSTPIGKMGDRT